MIRAPNLSGKMDDCSISLTFSAGVGLRLESRLLEMTDKASVTLPGTVEKVIPSVFPQEAGTVEIKVETAHDLYREVRIENTLTDESGGKASLKLGSPVEVTITAEAGSTTVRSGPPKP
jgi:hypothetical protein